MLYWLLSLLFTVCFCLHAMAQTTFVKTIPGGLGGRVIQTADGGFVFSGNGMVRPDDFEFYVMKLNSTGGLRWKAKIAGPVGTTSLKATRPLITELNNGGMVLAGTASNSNSVGNGIQLIRLNPSGGIAWQRLIDGDEHEYVRWITRTPDGGFIIAGGQQSITGESPTAALVLKFNGSGNLQWSRKYSDTLDEAYEIIPTPDGGYLLQSFWFNENNLSIQMNVKKLDSQGQVRWNRNIRGNNADLLPGGVVLTADGDYLVAAENVSNQFGSRGMLIQFNPSGNVKWKKAYRAQDLGITFSSVAVTNTGDFLAGGCSTTLSGSQCASFVMRISKTAKPLWATTIDLLSDIEFAQVFPTSDDGVIFTDRQLFPASENGDIKIMKLDSAANGPACLKMTPPVLSVQSPSLTITFSKTSSSSIELRAINSSFTRSGWPITIRNSCK